MINSFCIKTNNQHFLNYLQKKFNKIKLEKVYFSFNSFKIYTNMIIHYRGDNLNLFISKLSKVLTDAIIKFYEFNLFSSIIRLNYFYFTDVERKEILTQCLKYSKEKKDIFYIRKKEIIEKSFNEYFLEKNSLILTGFINFRLKEYTKLLDEIVDISVNNFLLEKEYLEFVNLLKIYIESKIPSNIVIHLIYKNGVATLLDDNKNILPLDTDCFSAKFLSDITFSTNDYCMNTLLSILPKKIYVYLLDEADEFINTLKLIFLDKVSFCSNCDLVDY